VAAERKKKLAGFFAFFALSLRPLRLKAFKAFLTAKGRKGRKEILLNSNWLPFSSEQSQTHWRAVLQGANLDTAKSTHG
jgi:hypothetical protein